MLTASYREFSLQFIKPARTSRGVMADKKGYLLDIVDNETNITGTGECSVLAGLSADDRVGYVERLEALCADISKPYDFLLEELKEWPSLRFGYECAMLDLKGGGRGVLFDTPFTRGLEAIPINGLVWMAGYEDMLEQVKQKLSSGFRVIKLKVGALDFEQELELLKYIREYTRKEYPANEITIRLDANGAFTPADALHKLERLAEFSIHSIEQPISAGQMEAMAEICRLSPIPVALDEELIGVDALSARKELVSTIKPAFIILKPSLVGGFASCNEWISICDETHTGYWITSALESNIGLNAIAQYTSSINTHGMAQGLGTGGLFLNNFETGGGFVVG
jgi:o-succinylbenzoate synthase